MTAANEYGRALFLITEEDGISDKVLSDVKLAEKIFCDNPEYVRLLNSPAVSKAERVSLADGAMGGLNESLLNLIKILTEKRQVHLFGKAAEEYYRLYDESRGILRVEAITAIPLTKKQSDAIVARLSASLGKTVIVSNTVDASCLGGMKLRYSGIQLDGTVKTRLDKFEEALKNTVI
jgi:F-type H+-transporting ATPase subunit delta